MIPYYGYAKNDVLLTKHQQVVWMKIIRILLPVLPRHS